MLPSPWASFLPLVPSALAWAEPSVLVEGVLYDLAAIPQGCHMRAPDLGFRLACLAESRRQGLPLPLSLLSRDLGAPHTGRHLGGAVPMSSIPKAIFSKQK